MPQSKKIIYRQLCEEKSIPLFMQAWWMDAVCGVDKWNVFLYKREDAIVAALPYLLLKKFFFRVIIQPMLTQYNGVWIDYSCLKSNEDKQALENEVMSDIIRQIEAEKIHYFSQNFHLSIHNCIPFIKNKFTQTTRYTYLIENISDPVKVFDNFRPSKKRYIKKSKKQLHVDLNFSAEDFYNFHVYTLNQKGKKIIYSKEIFMNIYNASVKRKGGQIFRIADKEGKTHSALFVVWNSQSSYYLITAIDNRYKSSGATSLMVWEAIQFLSGKTKVFDFEGSMIKNVAKTFSEYGSVKTPYINISKHYSQLFKFLFHLRYLYGTN